MVTCSLLTGKVRSWNLDEVCWKKAQGRLCTSSQMQRANIKQLPVPPEESVNRAKRLLALEEKCLIDFMLNVSICTYAQVCFEERMPSVAEWYHSPHNSLTSLVLTCQAMSP